jgi:hypothetical protein
VDDVAVVARVVGVVAFGSRDGTAVAALSDAASAREELLAAAVTAEAPSNYAAFMLLNVPAGLRTVAAGLRGGNAVLPCCYCVRAGNMADRENNTHRIGVFVTLFPILAQVLLSVK